jgi:predicted nucleotidyltransferase
MLTVERIREAVARVGKKYGIQSAFLFGSYAKGTANSESDVDILIDKGGALHNYHDYFYFCDELEAELGTNVDVATVDGLLPGIFDAIKKDRIPLYGA